MADSRSSLDSKGNVVPWRDNTQKVFFLTQGIVVGFAGDIEFAGSILSFVAQQLVKYPKLQNLHIFSDKFPRLTKFAYEQVAAQLKRRPQVGFIVAGMDFARPAPVKDEQGKYTGRHLAIFDKKVFKILAPNFQPEHTNMANPFVIMGSGEPGIEKLAPDFKEMIFGQVSGDLTFEAVVIDGSLREEIRKQNITTVGGLTQIAVIDSKGPRYVPYQGKREPFKFTGSDEMEVEMVYKDGRFTQRDLKTGKEAQLLYPPEVVKVKDDSSDLFANIEAV